MKMFIFPILFLFTYYCIAGVLVLFFLKINDVKVGVNYGLKREARAA
jgi:hypothetical protein